MLEVCLLGQFDVRKDGVSILLPSRPAQSLLAYLILTAGIAHRREKLSGLLWPDSSEDNARSNLRQALWRVRKALNDNSSHDLTYLFSDQFSVEFNPKSDYWLDASILERQTKEATDTNQLMELLRLYRGELLPGFYDDWVMLERERLQSLFDREVERLLEQLKYEQRWTEMLEWGEHWIAYGQKPEPAYRALMEAYGALGNRSKVAYTFDRCVKALRDDLEVEPSELTLNLYEKLVQGPYEIEPASATAPIDSQKRPSERPPYKGLLYFDEPDVEIFFGREELTARLVARLHQEQFLLLVGASGSGKSSIVRAGLVPAVKRGEGLADSLFPIDNGKSQFVEVISPTAHPLESLALTLARISESSIEIARFQDDLEHDQLGYLRAISKLLPKGARFSRTKVHAQAEEHG
jgi:DNA-binding SARP family transcriptional activator